MKVPPDVKYKTRHVPLDFEYQENHYKGEAVPVSTTCSDQVCWELEVTLNNEELGKIHCTKKGWRMDYVKDQGLVDAIGKIISLWYE